MNPAQRRFRVGAVIIDLDGTLLDTVADLVMAANAMRADLGLAPLAADRIASFVGKGAAVLVHRAITDDPHGQLGDAAFHRAHDRFVHHYHRCNGAAAVPYPGVLEGLRTLRAMALPLACVTNKPAQFTLPLLHAKGLLPYFAVVFSGDSFPVRKPDPLPMLRAAERLRRAPAQVLAIGDSANDAQAARAAGMPVVAVPYGYREGASLDALAADAVVETILEAARRIDPV